TIGDDGEDLVHAAIGVAEIVDLAGEAAQAFEDAGGALVGGIDIGVGFANQFFAAGLVLFGRDVEEFADLLFLGGKFAGTADFFLGFGGFLDAVTQIGQFFALFVQQEFVAGDFSLGVRGSAAEAEETLFLRQF